MDFRYSQDPRLTWWFDHHISAFQEPGDEAHFRADASGRKFYDPTAKSCARFLARTVAEKFGFDTGPVAELIEWAEIIDGALFPNPRMPVELKEPALRLMTWVENNRNPALAVRFIEDLVSKPLAAIAAEQLRDRAARARSSSSTPATSRRSGGWPGSTTTWWSPISSTRRSGGSTSSSSTTCTPRCATR